MSDGKIYITISDERGGGGGKPNTPPKPEPVKTTGKNDDGYDFILHQFKSALISQAKSNINFSISNIGNFTGDYSAQESTEVSVSAATQLAGVGIAAGKAYMKYGSTIGAAAPLAVVAVFGLMQSDMFRRQTQLTLFKFKQTEHETLKLRERAGFSGLTNGGRTGQQ